MWEGRCIKEKTGRQPFACHRWVLWHRFRHEVKTIVSVLVFSTTTSGAANLSQVFQQGNSSIHYREPSNVEPSEEPLKSWMPHFLLTLLTTTASITSLFPLHAPKLKLIMSLLDDDFIVKLHRENLSESEFRTRFNDAVKNNLGFNVSISSRVHKKVKE